MLIVVFKSIDFICIRGTLLYLCDHFCYKLLSSGNIGIYATRESYKWEDEKALAEYFVEQSKTNPVLYGFTLAYEPKLNKDQIKSMLTINENGVPEIEGREVPYLSYTAKGEAFNVR